MYLKTKIKLTCQLRQQYKPKQDKKAVRMKRNKIMVQDSKIKEAIEQPFATGLFILF